MFMTENIQAALLAIPMELGKMQAELRAGLQQFHNGQKITGARSIPLAGVRGVAWGGSGRLVGWSVRNAGTAPLVLTFRNGRDDSDEALATVELLADQGSTIWLGPGGVSFGEALWADVDLTAGAELAGAVWIGAVD